MTTQEWTMKLTKAEVTAAKKGKLLNIDGVPVWGIKGRGL